MIESPPAEGKFFCIHVAKDVYDIVEIMMEKKRFYKTILCKISDHIKRGDIKLLEYYSCKKCFTLIMTRAEEIRESDESIPKVAAHLNRPVGFVGEDGTIGYGYKIMGSSKSYGQRRHGYMKCLASYHKIRGEIGFTPGSGYKIDMSGVRTMWFDAYKYAYGHYYHHIHGSWPTESETEQVLDDDWLKAQKQSVRNRLTGMAKACLTISSLGSRPRFHRRFGIYPIMEGRMCKCGVFLEKGAKPVCRFCREPKERPFKTVLRKTQRLIAKDTDKDKRETMAEKFEDAGKVPTIAERVEEIGRNATYAELKEIYGRSEAREMMMIAGIHMDED